MRIVFLLSGYLHFTSELANALVQEGHEVTIVCRESVYDFVGSGEGDIKAEYRAILDPRINLEWSSYAWDTTPLTILPILMAVRKMAKTVMKYKPDVLHVMDSADYRYLLASKRVKRMCPLIMTVHDPQNHPGDSQSGMEFLRPYFRKAADTIIAIGKDIRERLEGQPGVDMKKTVIVPRGPYKMYQQWAVPGLEDDGRTVLLFGRMSKYKGFDYLIQAAPEVIREVPDVKFVVAGSGPDWERCRPMIKNPENFILRDEMVPEPEVSKLFQQSSILVLPYIEASQSGVLFVGYAFSKPCVVTNVGALPEVVDDGETGFIVPPRDPGALAQALIRLLKDDSLRKEMGAKGFAKTATGDLSWSAVAKRTVEVYEEAIARRKKGKR